MEKPTFNKHKKEAPKHLEIAIIVVSDTRYRKLKEKREPEDLSGNLIKKLFVDHNQNVFSLDIIPDELEVIQEKVKNLLNKNNIDAIILTGGTGLSSRDVTIEAVSPLIEKEIPGFGELVRKISFETIGSSAMLTRALAGISNRKVIFCLPGSPNAVELAVKQLILPELGHIIKHARD